MRLSRFMFTITFFTFFSLLYVWQQTEIFRLAYEGQKNFTVFQDLLDKNNLIRYNIKRNTSLIRIDNKVSKIADFQMPDNYRLVRLTQPSQNTRVIKYLSKKVNLVSRIFSIKRQAEAKTINQR